MSASPNELPPPPIPADADLRHFNACPIDYEEILSGSMALIGEAEAAVMWMRLFLSAWKQLPAGSLPKDDTILAQIAGVGGNARKWNKHKERALKGWFEASDGRLYHPLWAAKICKTLDFSKKQREKIKKRHNKESEIHKKQPLEDGQPIENKENISYRGTDESQRPVVPGKERKGKDIYIPPSLRSGGCPPPPCDQAVEKPPGGQPPLALEATEADELERAFSAYNAAAERAGLPKAQKFDAARKARLRQRLKDCGGLSGWVAALAKHFP